MPRLLILTLSMALMGASFVLSGGAAQAQTFPLSPQNASGASGSVTLTPSGAQTIVDIALQGTAAGSVHPAHIHLGTGCSTIGVIEANLTNVAVGGDGRGSSTTTVDMAITSILDGNHVVAAHRGPTLQADPTIIACGALPVATGSPTAEEPALALDEPAAELPGALPSAGTGGFLGQRSGGSSTPAFILVGVAAVLLAAGTIALRMSRIGR